MSVYLGALATMSVAVVEDNNNFGMQINEGWEVKKGRTRWMSTASAMSR